MGSAEATEVRVRELTYLVVLLACVLGTLPLEFVLRAGVYRRWQRAIVAILPVGLIFVLWDYFATRAGWWRFDRSYLTGVFAGPLPLEELLFFLVIPVCGLLTFEAVRHLRPRWTDGSSIAEPEVTVGDEGR
jgi:lycopene cyclase domain-containing protein